MRLGTPAEKTSKTSAYVLLLLTGTGVFLASLDQTVVVTALPEVFIDIELPVTDLDRGAWIVTGYLIGFTAAMPLVGRISDVYGHGRVYTAAMLTFMTGSALVAVGDDLTWLVLARVVQAIGGGALIPVTIAIVNDAFPESRRGIVIGAIAAIAEGGAVLGPLYGGLFIHFADWRWLFWINIPVGAVVIAAVLPAVANQRRHGMRVDYLGGLLLGSSIAALALGLSDDAILPAAAGWRAGLLASSAALFAAFVWREAVTRDPMLPLRLWSKATLVSANLTNLIVGAALILALVNIPLMTDTVLGEDPLEGGLRLLRMTVMIPVGAVLGGYLYQRLGYRLPTFLGIGLMMLGFGLLGRWPLDVGEPRITLELMVGGLGFGLVITPITVAVLNNTAEDQKATGSAMVTMMRMLGMIVGLSVLSSWGQSHFETVVGGLDLPLQMTGESSAAFDLRSDAYETGLIDSTLEWFHDIFFAALVVAGAALIPAFWLGWRSRKKER